MRDTWLNTRSLWLLGVVLAILLVAGIVARFLRKQPEGTVHPAIARTFNERVRAWWMMAAILVAGFLLGYEATVFLFGLVSFWALREFITMTPTRRSDHRTLFWVFFVITPVQYILVGMGEDWYPLYSILIPVYGWLFIPSRIAFTGDAKRFLERSAKILAGLIICVYSLSYAPAILDLTLETRNEAGELVIWDGSKPGLLFYFVLLVQLADVLQYGWGKLIGRHVIAPNINASRTWEGFCGGVASTTLVRRDALLGHAVWHLGIGLHGDGRGHHGVRRRDDHVGHQTRSRCEGLRHAGARARRRAGPHRLALLLRPRLLPPRPDHLAHVVSSAWRHGRSCPADLHPPARGSLTA